MFSADRGDERIICTPIVLVDLSKAVVVDPTVLLPVHGVSYRDFVYPVGFSRSSSPIIPRKLPLVTKYEAFLRTKDAVHVQ